MGIGTILSLIAKPLDIRLRVCIISGMSYAQPRRNELKSYHVGTASKTGCKVDSCQRAKAENKLGRGKTKMGKQKNLGDLESKVISADDQAKSVHN